MSTDRMSDLTGAVLRGLRATHTRWTALPLGLTVSGTLPGGPPVCSRGCGEVALFTRATGSGSREYACRRHTQDEGSPP